MELVLAIVPIVVVALLLLMKQSDTCDSWKEVAFHLGLHHRPATPFKGPKVMGRYKGFWIDLELKTRSTGKSATFSTSVGVVYPRRLRLGLQMTRTGLFTGLKKVLGAQDIEVGDLGFDDLVVIKGRDPKAVQEHLNPERRLAVKRLLETHERARITDTEISMEIDGIIGDPKAVVGILDDFTTTGSVLMDPVRS